MALAAPQVIMAAGTPISSAMRAPAFLLSSGSGTK